MLRLSLLAIALTSAFATEATAIEMFTFYGNGEHYAGYPFGGQHYVRAHGFDEHFAGTSFMAYARPEFRRHTAHATDCSCGHCGRTVSANAWDSYCAEKNCGRRHKHHFRYQRHHGHHVSCTTSGCSEHVHDSAYYADESVGEPVNEQVPTEAAPDAVEPTPEDEAPGLEDNPPQPPVSTEPSV